LSLIAILITIVFASAEILNKNAIESAKSINLAGYQRTLSQRIDIFADQYVEEDDAEQKQIYKDRLRAEQQTFAKNHNALIYGNEDLNLSGLAGQVAKDIYFSDPHQLDQQVSTFVSLLDELMETQNKASQLKILNELENMALNSLLTSLNAVVDRVESYEMTRKKRFILLERLSFGFALLLLTLELFFIFMPSQRFIKDALKEIEELEQQKAEKERMAIDATELGVWDINFGKNHVYFSDQWFMKLGYNPVEQHADLSTWENLMHPEDREQFHVVFKKHLNGETDRYTHEHRLRCKDGSYKWFLSQGRVFDRDDEGHATRIIGSHLDITELKLAKLEAEMFLMLAQNAKDSFVIADHNGGIEWVNPAFSQITGYSLDEVKGKKPGSFLQGKDTDPETVKKIAISLSNKEVVDTEILNYTKDGHPYWIRLLVTPLMHQNNNVQKFISIQRDVTDQKYYEANLKQIIEQKTKDLKETNLRLESGRARIEAIMQHVAEGLIVIDKMGTVLNFNRGAEKIFEYNAEEVIGQNVSILMQDDVSNHHDSYINNHLVSGEKKIIGKGREVVGSTKTGKTVPLFLSITRLETDGETFFIGTTRDISQEKEEQAKLEQAIEEARKANRAKDDFLANMSHELRTPLNSILGLTNILKKRADFGEIENKSLETISNASDTLLKTVNDILDISKIEAGKIVFEDVVFEINHFITNIVEHVKPLSDKKSIIFKSNHNEIAKKYYFADSFRIERVLVNVLTNAIKYTEEGFVKFNSNIVEKPNGSAVLTAVIEDTGIGIPADKIDTIFEKFTQSDESIERRYGGTGLGLSITKHLVHLMGGEIKVSSEENVGTKFEINIPLALAEDQNDTKTYEKKNQRSLNSEDSVKSIDQAKILIAEDNEFNIVFVEELLKNLKCNNFKIVTDGQQCVDEVKKNTYDLILMDCHMPVMNGFQAAKMIRDFNNHTPIIAVTADLRIETKLLCDKSGIDGYIAKPIDEDEFIQTLSRFLSIDRQESRGIEEATETIKSEQSFNLDILKKYVDGDEQRLSDLIKIFIEKSAEDIAKFQIYHDQGDHDAWCKMAHKLKGSAAYIQAHEMESICAMAQNLPLSEDDKRAQIHEEILKAYEKIIKDIKHARVV
jgi:PAS domain S-box-containing protein